MSKLKIETKDFVIYLVAFILSLTLILVIINFLQIGDPPSFLWACYIAIPLIIIGLLKKNPYIVLSQVLILAIPDLLWVIDFIFLIFTGHTILGLVNYFPNEPFLLKVSSSQHLYTVPLSLLSLSLMKLNKNYKIIFASIAEITIIFLLTLLLVPNGRDINCVYVNCISITPTLLPYYVEWFLFAIFFIVVSYFAIMSLLFIRRKSEKIYKRDYRHK